ncbi:SAF domain-containing protein [Kitasatospora sp. NPDC087861]|uniref:SAF domain-containing protein n=1 Tax=Kitasatospora sp. NPDC087861 TaxID=3364070 RepID=UPI003807DAD2
MTTTRVPRPPQASAPAAPAAPPVRQLPVRRRRPAMIAASVALIAVGSLAGAYLYVATGHRTPVLALAHDVPAGAVLAVDDLVEAKIATDPALKPVPAQDIKAVVGKRAVSGLPAGSLLTEKAITSDPLVGPGQQLVAVSLEPSRIPATPLAPGQKLQLVQAPRDGAGATTTQAPAPALTAVVVRVGKPASSGETVVDVAASTADSATLARWSARGEVALLVLPAGG